jgi:hypothetical protein
VKGPAVKPSPLAIKEEMVRREVEQVRQMGLEPSVEAADRYAVKQLERAAARNADRLKALARNQKKQRKGKQEIAQRMAERNGYRFQRSEAAPQPASKPKFVSSCACGGCIQCRREQRVRDVMRLGGAGDEFMRGLAWELVVIGLRAKAQSGEFGIVKPGLDRARVVTRQIEDVIDKSVNALGQWR